MMGLDTFVAGAVFTVVATLGGYISRKMVYEKKLKAYLKKTKLKFKADKNAMVKTTLFTFIMGLGVSLVYEWATAALAPYGFLGGAMLGAVLWIAFPLTLSSIAGAWMEDAGVATEAELLHWLIALIAGGAAVAYYLLMV